MAASPSGTGRVPAVAPDPRTTTKQDDAAKQARSLAIRHWNRSRSQSVTNLTFSQGREIFARAGGQRLNSCHQLEPPLDDTVCVVGNNERECCAKTETDDRSELDDTREAKLSARKPLKISQGSLLLHMPPTAKVTPAAQQSGTSVGQIRFEYRRRVKESEKHKLLLRRKPLVHKRQSLPPMATLQSLTIGSRHLSEAQTKQTLAQAMETNRAHELDLRTFADSSTIDNIEFARLCCDDLYRLEMLVHIRNLLLGGQPVLLRSPISGSNSLWDAQQALKMLGLQSSEHCLESQVLDVSIIGSCCSLVLRPSVTSS